jgi:hypothetical protein
LFRCFYKSLPKATLVAGALIFASLGGVTAGNLHGSGSSHNPIVYHPPVHGQGSSHNPIVECSATRKHNCEAGTGGSGAPR